jgi:hypothetical protein
MPDRRLLLLGLALLGLAGCPNTKSQSNLLTETLEAYAAVIRWNNFEQAVAFVDPETLKAHPVTPLDLQRYHQIQVTTYNERPPVPAGANEIRQVVEIGVVNVNTQAARTIVDNQVWHYDEPTKHWRLMSGLPDITVRDR